MTQLMFRCPNCQARVEVPPEKVAQVNQCPECGRPFQPEVPLARMLVQRADGEWAAVGAAAPGHPSAGEKTIMTVHPAMFRTGPLTYMAQIVAFIVGLAGMLIFGGPMKVGGLENWPRPVTLVLSIVFGIVAAVSLISLISWLLRTRFESLAITNERSIWARGIFERETSEVQHDDIRNIQVKQSLLDRILGVGRIAISSAGQDDMEIDVCGVPDPGKVADIVRSCQARMEGRGD